MTLLKEFIPISNISRKTGYEDDSQIIKRKDLYEFIVPKHNIIQEVINHSSFAQAKTVLDVGCGQGHLLLEAARFNPEASFIGFDISPGIFQKTKNQAEQESLPIKFVVGDAQSLRFPNRSFDRILAMHMLYHVPDIEKAVAELSRVLKDDGLLVITANSLESKPTLRQVKKKVAELLNTNEYPDVDLRFNIKSGLGLVKRFFPEVHLFSYRSVLELTDPEPYVNYFDSTRDFWSPSPNDEQWIQSLELVHQIVQKKIEEDGVFKEPNVFGILVASFK